MPLEPDPDLHWTAFLYVSGDLAVDEALSFEHRLADDQDARDALTEAVELAGVIALLGPEFRPRRRLLGRRVLVVASALAAAACLVLAIIPGFRAISPVPADASDVALAWSSLRGDADADWLALPSGSPLAGPAESDLIAENETEPSTDRALPSWLLTAASATVDDAPREED